MSRRNHPSCRSRAGPDRRNAGRSYAQNSGRRASGERPLPSVEKFSIGGSKHGQLFFRHRLLAARRAINDRDRRAPIALAADQPVAHAIVHFRPAQPSFQQVSRDAFDACLVGQTVIRTGIDHHARHRYTPLARNSHPASRPPAGRSPLARANRYLRANSKSRWS